MTDPKNSSYDSTWSYNTEYILGDTKTRIVIGCLDCYQAQRRAKLMRDKLGIRFKEEIV